MTDIRRFLWIGLLFFLYSLGISVAIQTYIVPKYLSQDDRGDSIVLKDSNGFNQLAKIKAEEIRVKGWGVWELRPQAHSPAGIASIFYALWTPKPYSLLPFNALVHALSGCLILWLLLHFFSWKSAFLGSALFVINPAAMQWVSQIHRDGIFILGNLLMLVCIVQFWCGLKSEKVRTIIWGLIMGVIGSCLVWVARPYWVQVLSISVILGLTIIAISFSTKRDPYKNIKYLVLYIIPCVLCLLLVQGWLGKSNGTGLNALIEIPQRALETRHAKEIREAGETKETRAGREARMASPLTNKWFNNPLVWKQTAWVPEVVERKLYQILQVRRGATATVGNTVVDPDIVLNSVPAYVAYFPRALQLGFLSPLPELWGGEGSTPTMTIARKVMGVVTVIFYFCLFGAFVGIYLFRKNPLSWLLLMFSSLGIMVFIYAYPNIGTFLRFRYGFYMLLIAFGAANIAELFFARYGKRNN